MNLIERKDFYGTRNRRGNVHTGLRAQQRNAGEAKYSNGKRTPHDTLTSVQILGAKNCRPDDPCFKVYQPGSAVPQQIPLALSWSVPYRTEKPAVRQGLLVSQFTNKAHLEADPAKVPRCAPGKKLF